MPLPEGHTARPSLSKDRYTLMCKNHEVARFQYHARTRSVRSLEILDGMLYAPPGACDGEDGLSPASLGGWIAMRYIPHTREGLSGLLRTAGCANPTELMFSSLGLNLSDQYWFRPAGIELDWHDVNYFENAYVDGRPNLPVSDGGWTVFGPGTSTGGQVLKWWERRGATSYLVKGSTAYGHEPYAEVLATELYRCVCDEGSFVPYTLELRDGEPYSACPCFIDAGTELATMDDLFRRFGCEGSPLSLFEEYVAIAESLGIAGVRRLLSQMLVCDYLMGNPDRHEYNLGVVLDAETKSARGLAPLFDNGRGFYYGARRADQLTAGLFAYAARPFDPVPEHQLDLACDLSWFDAEALAGFSERIEEVLSGNGYAPAWFAQAAAAQFRLRLAEVCRRAG